VPAGSAVGRVRIVWDGCEEFVDFVVPTVDDARALIAQGALNGRELLEDSGMTPLETDAELVRLRDGRRKG
jgi:hypothetical protein